MRSNPRRVVSRLRSGVARSLATALLGGLVATVGLAGESHVDHAAAARHSLSLPPEQCVAAGGRMLPVCIQMRPACVVAFPDAGKPCANTADCKGGCYIDFEKFCAGKEKCFSPNGPPSVGDQAVGHCRASNNPCGSFWQVDGGKVIEAYMAD